ncbi:hypothetical protein RYX36_024471 [Vicia faba]
MVTIEKFEGLNILKASVMSSSARTNDLIHFLKSRMRILSEGKFMVSGNFLGNENTKYCLTLNISVGVILAIQPFNYPVNLAVSKIAPALIARSSIVLKPLTQGAIAALHMVHCFHLAGFPKGLIRYVIGKGSEIGDFLTMHQGVNCISFTGRDTGIAISKKPGMIPLLMELGGKDSSIVLEDVDLYLVVANIIKGGFSFSGQRCTTVKVVLVMESVVGALVEKVKVKVAKLSVEPPENESEITTVVSESSANFIEGLVNDAKEKGATFCQEYKREGNLIWLLLLDNVRRDMRTAWEDSIGSLGGLPLFFSMIMFPLDPFMLQRKALLLSLLYIALWEWLFIQGMVHIFSSLFIELEVL